MKARYIALVSLYSLCEAIERNLIMFCTFSKEVFFDQ